MKKKTFILALTTLIGCNMSDDVIDLPNGHQYIIEGSCSNRILINSKNIPDIEYVKKCEYNEDYISVLYTDSLSCRQDNINEKTKIYKVLDVKKNKVIGPMNHSQYIIFYNKFINDEDLKLK
jgi:hypothetical protein